MSGRPKALDARLRVRRRTLERLHRQPAARRAAARRRAAAAVPPAPAAGPAARRAAARACAAAEASRYSARSARTRSPRARARSPARRRRRVAAAPRLASTLVATATRRLSSSGGALLQNPACAPRARPRVRALEGLTNVGEAVGVLGDGALLAARRARRAAARGRRVAAPRRSLGLCGSRRSTSCVYRMTRPRIPSTFDAALAEPLQRLGGRTVDGTHLRLEPHRDATSVLARLGR